MKPITTIQEGVAAIVSQSITMPDRKETKESFDWMKDFGMTLAYKTNVALSAGFPRIEAGMMQSLTPGTRDEEDNFRINLYPIERWYNQVSEPVPEMVKWQLGRARDLNIFDEYFVLGGPTEQTGVVSKDPLLLGAFSEGKHREGEIIFNNYEPYRKIPYDLFHAIAWWGHDINFSKLNLA